MLRVLVKADKFAQLYVGAETVIELCRKWPRVRLGIVDGLLELEIAVLHPVEPLDDLPATGEWAAAYIEPAVVHEAGGLDDQRAPFPATDRVAVPPWLRVCGERSTVEKHFAHRRARSFVDQHHLGRRLDELSRARMRVHLRHAHRQTIGVGI